MKSITEDSDNINKQYTCFQELQQSIVQRTLRITLGGGVWSLEKSSSLMSRIFDLLKINKELRDYDFKKIWNRRPLFVMCSSSCIIGK